MRNRAIRKRVERRKLMVVYRLLLGDADTFGMLGRLWDEAEPAAARILASQSAGKGRSFSARAGAATRQSQKTPNAAAR